MVDKSRRLTNTDVLKALLRSGQWPATADKAGWRKTPADEAGQRAWLSDILVRAAKGRFEPADLVRFMAACDDRRIKRELRESQALARKILERALEDHVLLHDLHRVPRCADPLVKCDAETHDSEAEGLFAMPETQVLLAHANACRLLAQPIRHVPRGVRDYGTFMYQLHKQCGLKLKELGFLLAWSTMPELQLPVKISRIEHYTLRVQNRYSEARRRILHAKR